MAIDQINLPKGFELEQPVDSNLPDGFELEQLAGINLPKDFELESAEQTQDEETGSYAKQLLGSFVKGGMRLGQAVLQIPKHVAWLAMKAGGLQTDRPPEPGEPMYELYKSFKDKPTFGAKIAEFQTDMIERHKRGTQRIIENHPEWDYEPPENFVDLLTSPRKLSLIIAESTPVFIGAGIMTAGGRPDVGLAMMYAAEGQEAYNQAIVDGATPDEANTAYHLYGSVASVIEYLQLKGIMKIGKGTFKVVLASTTKKIAGKGLKSITKDIIKTAATEAIEEITQGAWQEATAKIVYDKSIPGGLWDFIDRRAQEGLVGFAMGVIPGVGGAGAAAIQARVAGRPAEVVTPTEPIVPTEPVGEAERLATEIRLAAHERAEAMAEQVEPPIEIPKKMTHTAVETILSMMDKAYIAEDIGKITQIKKALANRIDEALADGRIDDARAAKEIWVGVDQIIFELVKRSKQAKPEPTPEEVPGPEAARVEVPVEERVKPERKITGEKFKEKFQKTESLEQVQFTYPVGEEEALRLGEALGPGEYFSITPEATTHYSSDDYATGINYAYLKDNAKIYVAPDLHLKSQEFINKLREEYDGAYDSSEGTEYQGEGVPHLGLVVWNPEVISETPIEPTPEKPAKLSRKKALTLGHQLPKTMGWDDAQRRDFMRDLVGKSSMKGMTPKEMRIVVEALQSQARDMGLMPEEDYQKRMWIGTREVDTGEYIDAALAQVEELPNLKGAEPKVITRRLLKRKRGLVSLAKDILVGVNNLSIPHLMRKIGGVKEGPMKEVGVDGWRRNIHRVASVFRGAVTQLNEAFDTAGITPNDLAKMSRSLDPRLELIKRGREITGKPKTKVYTFKINDKQYQLSMGELIDIYLSAQQEQGLKHITKYGLEIFGTRTGPINEATLKTLTDVVDKDAKAKVFTDTVVKISDEYNAPQMNYTDKRINPETLEKIADEKNFWHLEVAVPRRIRGKGTYQISALENKNILRPRKKDFGALVVRDAFPKFFSVQYAVSEYVGMAEELRAINLLLNYEPIINQLEKKGYKGIRNNIKQLVEWVQDKRTTTVRADALLSKILHGSFRAVLHYSPEVIASQYMSTGHYAGVTPLKYHKMLLIPPKPSLIKEMLEHNPVVWMRYYAGGQSAELAEVGQLDVSLRLLAGHHADLNRTGIAAQTTDLFAFAQGWKIAKAIITDTTNLKPGTTEFFDAVNDKVEELWDTQPSWDKWNKSINTSQRGIKRLPFLFRSYFEKSLMMLHTANETYRVSNKTVADKAKRAQVFGAVMGSQIATALIRTFIGWAVWRQRKTVWDYIGAMLAAPFVMVSIVGGYLNRVVGNTVRILAGQKQRYEGEPISSLPIKVIEWLLIGIGQMTKAAAYHFAGEEEKSKKSILWALRNLTISIGTMRGLPVRQVEKGIKAIKAAIDDTFVGETEEEIKLSRKRG